MVQQLRHKLDSLLNKSTDSLTFKETLALATEPLGKIALKHLTSSLTVLKESVANSLSQLSKHVLTIEATEARITKHLDEKLASRKVQLTSLDAQVSLLGEECSNLDAEIRRLCDRRAVVVECIGHTVVELEKANREASRELEQRVKCRSQAKGLVEVGIRDVEMRANIGLANWWKQWWTNFGLRGGASVSK
ncbi:hypothetical protein LINGRAPRIM_LOCUS1458 [Linum grandiflorum]